LVVRGDVYVFITVSEYPSNSSREMGTSGSASGLFVFFALLIKKMFGTSYNLYFHDTKHDRPFSSDQSTQLATWDTERTIVRSGHQDCLVRGRRVFSQLRNVTEKYNECGLAEEKIRKRKKVKLLSKPWRNIGRADLQPHKLFFFCFLWSTKQNRSTAVLTTIKSILTAQCPEFELPYAVQNFVSIVTTYFVWNSSGQN